MSAALDTDLHLRAGTAARHGYDLEITPADAGWSHSSLRTLTLAPGTSHVLETGDEEMMVVPLAGPGGVAVECDDATAELAGRADVFAGPTDVAYLPIGSHVVLTS